MVELLLASMAGGLPAGRPVRVDPLIEAIDAYRTGLATFNATPSAITDLDEDAIVERTYGPPMSVLMEWDQPALTFQGAMAALKMADDENICFTGSVIADNMVKAAVAYFGLRNSRTVTSLAGETSIQRLYQDWKAVRNADDPFDSDDEAQAKYKVYAALQEQITAMKPSTARDMATQLVVETDFGDSDYRAVFFERVAALAEGA
tara:strand:- start:82 stop:696 length:615 start_codon:yes stop_codon:yes gene_type:complete